MEQESSKKQVLMRQARPAGRTAPAPRSSLISDLGLVEMTRQRERESLFHYFSEACPTCAGTGKTSLALTASR
ncbi:MAG: hypothetical protein IPK72_11850 [Candidatus Eisenbacteria bacterium]|nr:hypothetical protein [Candidatus Eisenbacteria bacterium]